MLASSGATDKPLLQGSNTANTLYWGADKSLARQGRKQATATKL